MDPRTTLKAVPDTPAPCHCQWGEEFTTLSQPLRNRGPEVTIISTITAIDNVIVTVIAPDNSLFTSGDISLTRTVTSAPDFSVIFGIMVVNGQTKPIGLAEQIL